MEGDGSRIYLKMNIYLPRLIDIYPINMNTPYLKSPVHLFKHYDLANCETCKAIPLDYNRQDKLQVCKEHKAILKSSRCVHCNKKASHIYEENVLLCAVHIRPILRDNFEILQNRFFELALTINQGLTLAAYYRDAEAEIDNSGLTEFILKSDLLMQILDAQEEVERLREENGVPPPTVTEELGKLAYDSQNVHTQHVNTQTAKGLQALITQQLPKDWSTTKILTREFPRNKKMTSDIMHWYNTATCRIENDKLYAKSLDGLLSMIEVHQQKKELYKRFKEEAIESVGMCCEGHLSRLCNVMVGFDDRFNPPVPVKEILQQKMAKIASKEISVEEKVFEAFAVFKELGIPKEEYDAWIEAF